MARPPNSRPSGPGITRLVEIWASSLRAENKSARTIDGYVESVDLFTRWLVAEGRPTQVDAITRGDIEGFLASVLARHKPSTAATRYKGLRQFFRWAEEEGDVPESPMLKMRPPIVPDEPVPVVEAAELRKLLKGCAGKDFESRRDLAVLSLLIDTGIRLSEVAGLTVDDVDLGSQVVYVMGKGRRPRAVPFGAGSARALGRWLIERDRHPRARVPMRGKESPALWLGTQGRTFGPDGVRQMVERRGKAVGIPDLHTHRFRHSFAHAWLSEGGAEGDLMMLAGWKSRQMLQRYGSSVAAERARKNYTSPVDRL